MILITEFQGEQYQTGHLNAPNTTASKNVPPSISVCYPSLNENKIPPFESHLSMKDAFKLKVHDGIDHRDGVGRFVNAIIQEVRGTNLKIHYVEWSRKWNTWNDFSKELYRFAKAGSISRRPAHRFKELKEGDYVDINPLLKHPGWKCAEIRKTDKTSGQIQVVYEEHDKNYLYWTHLDNCREIAEFTSKSGTLHATQIDRLRQQSLENVKARNKVTGAVKAGKRQNKRIIKGFQGGGHNSNERDESIMEPIRKRRKLLQGNKHHEQKETYSNLINSGFTSEEAMNAINLSDENEESKEDEETENKTMDLSIFQSS